MSELRRDPIIGQWVIVHTEDSLSPESYEKQDQISKHVAVFIFLCLTVNSALYLRLIEALFFVP